MAPSSASSTSIRIKKEKKSPTFYGFHTFAEFGCPISVNGAFRDNIRRFLQQCGELEDYAIEGMHVWCTFLVYENEGAVLPLYTVEENVEKSENPFCDYCRCSGWTNNFISRRKYHLIIPTDDDWSKPLEEGCFDLQSHLLHGLIHCNGYGHLLCVNGVEGGSKYIHGREIMDLWDRICTSLHVGQISVEDLSKKGMIDFRLLHGVAYGQSWFGNWGYRFGLGSFGVKEHNYEKAIEVVGSLDLDDVLKELNFSLTPLKSVINHYRKLSETHLVTMRDLFRFLLSPKFKSERSTGESIAVPTEITMNCPLKSCTRISSKKTSDAVKHSKCRKFSNLAATMDSRWPVRRLENVAEVIVDALKEKRAVKGINGSGMSRQEARDAARLHIGDTGLIDHVLKSMNNVIVGNYIVRRAVDRSTKILEYTIHDLDKSKEVAQVKVSSPVEKITISPGRNVWDDFQLLCKNLLIGKPGGNTVKLAVQTILNSKHFIKEWPFRDEDEYSLRFSCRIANNSIELSDELPNGSILSNSVIVGVPLHATVGDLKMAVQYALRDTYCMMGDFEVTDIVEMEEFEDEEVLFGITESGREIRVRGYGLDMDTDLRYEAGANNWTVRCKCGASDDDGEPMVSCDICEVWQHTICVGIEDADKVPRFFICNSCCFTLAPAQIQAQQCGMDWDMDSPMTMGNKIEVDTGMMYC